VHIGQVYFYSILKRNLEEFTIILRCKIKGEKTINERKIEALCFFIIFTHIIWHMLLGHVKSLSIYSLQ